MEVQLFLCNRFAVVVSVFPISINFKQLNLYVFIVNLKNYFNKGR